jgi:MtrB/PioB family decaheme-associated outer membrane protein
MGAMAELSFDSPWYVRFDGNQVKRKGINVFAGAQGTSPGNGFVDLPAPIDYKTNNASVEAGYQGQASHFAVSGMYSKFSNDNELLRWSNGFFSPANPLNRDTTVLPPENELVRLSANGNIRKLPGDSTLAGRVTWSKLTNDVPILPTMLSTGSTNPATGSSGPTFNGEIKKTTLGLSFSSHPLAQLDTRFYYNYAKEDNNSTHLTFTSAALGCAPSCVPEPFEYKKHNLGFEAGYRINRANRLTGGFDYYDVERERIDFTDSEDKKFFIEWKNSSLDVLTARIKYQYLDRDSTYVLTPTSPLVVANPTEFYVRRFDLANVEQNMIKLVLDASPIPFVDLGFEAIYKKNDYKDTALGRTEDERQEYYASVSFGDPKKFRVMIFGDIELLQIDSRHRVGGTTLANSNPAAPPSGASALGNTIYTWDAKNEDKAWQVGVGADWLPMERLRLNASLIYAKTEGTTDFAAQAGTLVTVPFLPITNFDNTKRTALNLKGTYKLDRNWSMTAGYAYERYKYSDIGYDGFRYVAGTGTSAAYMTGQYAFQPYSANIFYVVGTYKF